MANAGEATGRGQQAAKKLFTQREAADSAWPHSIVQDDRAMVEGGDRALSNPVIAVFGWRAPRFLSACSLSMATDQTAPFAGSISPLPFALAK